MEKQKEAEEPVEVQGVGKRLYAINSSWLILVMGGELETGSAVHTCGCCTKIGQY